MFSNPGYRPSKEDISAEDDYTVVDTSASNIYDNPDAV